MSLLLCFEVARLALLTAILGVAALQDHRTGEASNKLWLYIPLGAALTVIQVLVFTPYLAVFAFPLMAAMGVVSLVLFYVSPHFSGVLGEGGFGGADSKALLAVSVGFPLTPSFSVFPYVNLVLVAFVAAGLMLVVYKGFHRGRAVRFLPYLFVGFLLAVLF